MSDESKSGTETSRVEYGKSPETVPT